MGTSQFRLAEAKAFSLRIEQESKLLISFGDDDTGIALLLVQTESGTLPPSLSALPVSVGIPCVRHSR